jgi:hypothetical protein
VAVRVCAMCKGLGVSMRGVVFGGKVKVGRDKVVEEWLCGGGGSARFGAGGRHGGRRSGSLCVCVCLEAGCRRIKADTTQLNPGQVKPYGLRVFRWLNPGKRKAPLSQFMGELAQKKPARRFQSSSSVWLKARPEAFPFRIVWRGAEGSNKYLSRSRFGQPNSSAGSGE